MNARTDDWRASPVAVVGCGGLGVPAAWSLALAGARHMRLIDPDVVEPGNLHRQVLYTEAHVGRDKVVALAEALRERFPQLEVDARATGIDAVMPDAIDEALRGCVAVVEGSDDAACKFAVNDALVRAWRQPESRGPEVGVIAAAIARRGQWMVVHPEGACYRCLFEEPPPPERLASCETAGVLGPVVGLAGAAAARALALTLDGGRPPAFSALVQGHAGRLRRTLVLVAGDCGCSQSR